MKGRHAICLVVDGLRASALGTYGNTNYPTPCCDALAGQSLVVEWLWANSPSLEGFYKSAWQNGHGLPEQLHQAGVMQWLATDDPWLIEQATHLPLDEALLFETHAECSAESIEATTIAEFFSLTVERLAQWQEDVAENEAGSLLWLHTRGLFGPLDAPRALRAELLEEGDPPPTDEVLPPAELRHLDDPDVLLAQRVAYAAQISVLDACLGAFFQAIEHTFGQSETLVMLLGSRGFALGEHGSIGSDCQELFSERLHLPWLLHVCGNTIPMARSSGLAQPADVGATLLDWLGVKPVKLGAPYRSGISLAPQLRGERTAQRPIAISTGINGESVARTHDWMLRSLPSAEDLGKPTLQLYAKPDDRWECNDVAARCPEEISDLSKALEDIRQRPPTVNPASSP